jgi:hypothetical protein
METPLGVGLGFEVGDVGWTGVGFEVGFGPEGGDVGWDGAGLGIEGPEVGFGFGLEIGVGGVALTDTPDVKYTVVIVGEALPGGRA